LKELKRNCKRSPS